MPNSSGMGARIKDEVNAIGHAVRLVLYIYCGTQAVLGAAFPE